MQIIVLGMHRSGTSMVSRIMNLMGCYFGDEHVMMEPAPDNPKGFWERTDVMKLNNDILSFAGASWWDVDHLDLSSLSLKSKTFIRESMGSILLRLEAHRPWVIKDPRLCLTLDYWLEMLEVPVFLFVFRSPIQVAGSLQKRNNIPLKYGLALWEYYNLSLLRSLGDKQSITLSYSTLLQTPYESMLNIFESLTALGVSGLRMPGRQEIESFVDPALCHFADPGGSELLSPEQFRLYESLNKSEAFTPAPDRINLLAEQMGVFKQQGDWAVCMEQNNRIETTFQRLNRLEDENARLKKELADRNNSRLVRAADQLSQFAKRGYKRFFNEKKN